MSETPRTSAASRRTVLKAAAWTTPTIAVAAAAPAMAATPKNQRFAVEFDNASGVNGYLQASYLNVGMIPSVGEIALTQPITIRFDVVGLMPTATNPRDFSASTSFGDLARGSYNRSTQTIPFTWTIPAGTQVNTIGQSARVPDVLFSWRDGAHNGGRITNKIVVRSITGGMIVQPKAPPIDSSVVHDRTGRDGIY